MENIENLIFEPLHNYFSGGTNMQVCATTYKGINITWRTIFPWNVFKQPSDFFTLDYIVKVDSEVKNGRIATDYYTEDGLGLPEFSKIEDAINYINKIKP